MQILFSLSVLVCLFSSSSSSSSISHSWSQANNFEGSSSFNDLQYHMGPVLASPIKLYIIWYGNWNSTNHQETIRDFIYSLSSSEITYPSVSNWWQTVRLYSDQTGSNITQTITLSGESYDSKYSHGDHLTRLSIQSIIKTSVTNFNLPLNPYNGVYLVLTSGDVLVQDFCRAACGFHYFTFPHVAGVTAPYAWIGYSGSQCPGMCAYPFASPNYSGGSPRDIMKSPNGDPGIDGMISVIAHELAEVSSNPLVNAWYGGDNPISPNEIADLCMGVYGSGGGGGYVGQVYTDKWGNGYNVNGVKGRKFMLQWIWNPDKKRCFGPNAMD